MLQTRSSSPLATLGCLAFGALILIGTFFAMKAMLSIYLYLWVGALIAALIIDWKLVASSLKTLFGALKREPLGAMISGVLALPFAPFGWLFMGIAKRKMASVFNRFQQDFQNMAGTDAQNPFTMGSGQRGAPPTDAEYVDYKEVESKKKQG
jgi:hypothetical protein